MDKNLLKKYQQFISTADQEREKTYFSLGPLSINLAVGNLAGVPSGRIVQIAGKSSSGKSTLALAIIAEYLRKNPLAYAMYVDFERTFDQRYSKACGVILERLYVVRPDTTEQGFNIIEDAIKSGDIKLVIIDSVAAAKPSSEDDKSYDQSPKMASNAGLLTRFCNRIVPLIDNNDALIVMINQMRKNFNPMSREDEVPWGGLALLYQTSVLIQMQRIKTEDTKIEVRALVKKNKIGAPQVRAEYTLEYGQGINFDIDVLNLALDKGIIEKRGSWFNYGTIKAQGELNAIRLFPIDEIKAKVVDMYMSSEKVVATDEVEEEFTCTGVTTRLASEVDNE